jgi:DNA-binding IclR family transcriptional regulator
MTSSIAARPEDGSAERRAAGSPGVHAALSVIEQIVAEGPLSLGDLARALGLPKSTLHRICTVLVTRGWAVRDEQGCFQAGLRALSLGSRASDLPVITGFREAAARLRERHDETVCLAVLDGADSVFIAIEETTEPLRLVTWVGRRAPAFASASGRVLLAPWPPAAVEAELGPSWPLVMPTGRSLETPAELHSILARVRRDGYAENEEDTAVGLYTASVPIVNDANSVLVAMTMCVPTCRLDAARRERILADLQEAGRALSRELAWLPVYYAKRV